jgi:acetate kinase
MRKVLARAAASKPEAQLALDVYVHRLRTSIGAMAAALGGLDALVFHEWRRERSGVEAREDIEIAAEIRQVLSGNEE